MVVFLNGRFVAEEAALVSVFDRGFLYGDGVFETLRVVRGLPFQWEAHLDRLARGAELLGILPPLTSGELRLAAARLVGLNSMPDAILRIILTRGPGPRGYSPKGALSPTLAMTLHSPPQSDAKKPARLRLITSSLRVMADDPLANVKTCNKLPHILARAEADRVGADDALLLNTRGQLAEATASNIFWCSGNILATPPKWTGALSGITRKTILQLAGRLGLACCEADEAPPCLHKASGVFLTNSVSGVSDVAELDGKPLAKSRWTQRLHAAYEELVKRNCAG